MLTFVFVCSSTTRHGCVDCVVEDVCMRSSSPAVLVTFAFALGSLSLFQTEICRFTYGQNL